MDNQAVNLTGNRFTTVKLTLSNPTGGATLGTTSSAVLKIMDDEVPQPGAVQFNNATYSVAENAGTAMITVERIGGSDGSITVNYATGDDSAAAGIDYDAASGTLTFGNGETIKTFTVTITNNELLDGTRILDLQLSNPTGDATLGSRKTATLAIADDEASQSGGPAINEMWTYVGPAGFSPGVGVAPNISLYNGTPYVEFIDVKNLANAALMKYDGQNWQKAVLQDALLTGKLDLSTLLPNITVPGLNLRDLASQINIPGLNSNLVPNQTIDIPGLTGQSLIDLLKKLVPDELFPDSIPYSPLAAGAAFYMDKGTPYIVYRDGLSGLKATVIKSSSLFGVNPLWSTVGDKGFTENPPLKMAVYTKSGSPYVVYQDSKNFRAIVMKYDGSQWQQVGIDQSVNGIATFYVDKGSPYLAYSDVEKCLKATVMKFNGTNWEIVGDAGFSCGPATDISLFVDNGVPYVAFEDILKKAKATVMKFDGTTWKTIGNAGFSSGPVLFTSLFVDNGTPYLAFMDTKNSEKATVMKFDGEQWNLVGAEGFTEGKAILPKLAVFHPTPTSYPIPYVTFGDDHKGNKISVMKVILPGTFQFSSGSYNVEENVATGNKMITVQRVDGSETEATVDYTTEDATGISGNDYTATSGTLTFGIGETTKTFTVPVLDNQLYDKNRTVKLTLSNPTGGTTLGQQKVSRITILDDETGTVLFSNPTFSAAENAGTVDITLERVGRNDVEASVDYSTADDTAVDGKDYTATGGTLTFAIGETSKTFTISLFDNGRLDGDRTVNLSLSNPTGGLLLGDGAVLTILDDETGTVQFTSTAYSIREDAGTAEINIERTGKSENEATVDVATADDTALAGTDYTASNETVTFAPGEINATFKVPVFNRNNASAPRSLKLTLSNPTGGLVLGTRDQATLTILERSLGSSRSSNQNTQNSQNSIANGLSVFVNGQEQTNSASVNTVSQNDKTVSIYTPNEQKLQQRLATEEEKPLITIPAMAKSDIIIGELTGQMVSNMEQKQASLEVRTAEASYILPAVQININEISKQIGTEVALHDIKVQVTIAKTPQEAIKVVENAAKQGEFTIMAPPVDFTVTCSYENKTIPVNQFNAYVERMIAIPEGVDPTKVTTGVVLNADGTVTHVPTQIVQIDGKYYAKMNSLTNSTYAVIAHPKTFVDVANHWAKKYVNEMGSRLVINGVTESTFEPDREITRAEFSAIIARALGLHETGKANPFRDISAGDWYTKTVATAYNYGIVSGYKEEHGITFDPNKAITREEAMAMIARAMKIAGINTTLSEQDGFTVLKKYADSENLAPWAAQSAAMTIKNGIVVGSDMNLNPGANITRAETAAIVMRMLQKANLIN